MIRENPASRGTETSAEVVVSKYYLSTDQPDTQSRSLLSRSRVNRAVEAARRVGGGLIVAALNVGGLRSGAGGY